MHQKKRYKFNPLTLEPPVQDSTTRLSSTISCDHSLEIKSYELRYPINTKISAIFSEYQHLNLDKKK